MKTNGLAAVTAALLVMNLVAEAHAAVSTWSGSGTNSYWTTSSNWVGNVAPVAGDDLVFPASPGNLSPSNNFPAGTVFNSITLGGNFYSLDGSNITLNAGIEATNLTPSYVYFPFTLNASQTIVSSNAGINLFLYGNIDLNGHDLTFAGNGSVQVPGVVRGPGGLIKTGAGGALLYASNTFSGPVQVRQGNLNIYDGNALGSTAGTTIVSNGATLTLANPITVPEPLVLAGLLSSAAGPKTQAGPVELVGTAPVIQIVSGAPLTINAVISGSGGFTKMGAEILTLNSNNTYTGTTLLGAGTLQINGSQPASPIVLSNGVLEGIGAAGTIASISPGFPASVQLSPGGSPGILASSNVVLNSASTFVAELHGPTPGTGYDQLSLNGSVSLSNAALLLSLGYTPAIGDAFTIINNDGADAVAGVFNGRPEGAYFSVNGTTFRITYAGGTGNDVVVVRTNAPPAEFTPGGSVSNGVAELPAAGLPGITYSLEAASNLNPVIVWTSLGPVVADGSGLISFTDTNAPSFPMRFYRIKSP